MKTKQDFKILLVQVREDEMADHEFKVVFENSGLDNSQFDTHNVIFDTPFELSKLHEYDAVMIGGSGSYSVLDDEPFISFLENIARYCRENNIPFLGLCYGFQIAVQALGGKVIQDKPNKEVGSYVMTRTKESEHDSVVGTLPQTFDAACGRKDRAEVLAPGMINLVSSERCSFHAITYPDSKFYAVQFHPELWKKSDNLVRVNHYKDKYGMNDEQYEEQIKKFSDCSESGLVIKNFIYMILE